MTWKSSAVTKLQAAVVVIIIIIALIIGVYYATFLGPAPTTVSEFEIVGITFGVRGDMGWGDANYESMQKFVQENPKIKGIVWKEGISYSELEDILRSYLADPKYPVIVGFGYEFGEVGLKIMPEYPNKILLANSGPLTEEPPPNMGVNVYDQGEAGFLMGALASYMTKTKKIGMVGGSPGSSTCEFLYGAMQAAYMIDQSIEVKYIMTGEWGNPSAGRDAADSLIAAGCDVIIHYADGTGLGAMLRAKERGVYACGGFYSGSATVGDNILGAFVNDFYLPWKGMIKDYCEGKWNGPYVVHGTIASGFIDWLPGPACPSNVKALVDSLREKIRSGEIIVQEIPYIIQPPYPWE